MMVVNQLMMCLQDREEVHYVWLPITLACIFAYFIASCFLRVYEVRIQGLRDGGRRGGGV